MKIGTCVNFSEIDGMEKKFAQLREHNFDSCQLVSWNPAAWTDENANTLKTLLEQYQITVSAFWCGWTGACGMELLRRTAHPWTCPCGIPTDADRKPLRRCRFCPQARHH